MTDRPAPRAFRSFAGVAVFVALVVAGCGQAAPTSPAWSVAPSSAASTAVASPTHSAAPSANATPTVAPAAGLGATCAAQWAASISTYADGGAGTIPVVLIPSQDAEAASVEPTRAALQTDHGPVALTVAMVSSDENDTLWGTTRLELGLPVLEPGTYRAEFLDLTDESGTWRFRVGELVIHVLADAAPGDLEYMGGTIRTSGLEGGSVQSFEIRLRNATDRPIAVTAATTDIPGLPVTWVLVGFDPIRAVDRVAIPADTKVTVTVGTESIESTEVIESTDKTVSFVLATPEITYRVGTSAEREAIFGTIEFQSGFGQPGDVTSYRRTLPEDACGQAR